MLAVPVRVCDLSSLIWLRFNGRSSVSPLTLLKKCRNWLWRTRRPTSAEYRPHYGGRCRPFRLAVSLDLFDILYRIRFRIEEDSNFDWLWMSIFTDGVLVMAPDDEEDNLIRLVTNSNQLVGGVFSLTFQSGWLWFETTLFWCYQQCNRIECQFDWVQCHRVWFEWLIHSLDQGGKSKNQAKVWCRCVLWLDLVICLWYHSKSTSKIEEVEKDAHFAGRWSRIGYITPVVADRRTDRLHYSGRLRLYPPTHTPRFFFTECLFFSFVIHEGIGFENDQLMALSCVDVPNVYSLLHCLPVTRVPYVVWLLPCYTRSSV